MTATNDERRKMAAELRQVYKDSKLEESESESMELYLADLIDWPTCTVVKKVTEINQPENLDPLYRRQRIIELCCSNCGEAVWDDNASIWNFCPNCGAEVVVEDDE